MKLICLFLLVGLTLLQIADAMVQPADCKEPLREDEECLNDAIKRTSGVPIKLQNFMCKYQTAKKAQNIELMKECYKETKEFIHCLGCDADFLLGTDVKLEDLAAEDINNLDYNMAKLITNLINIIETDETAMQDVCPLVTNLVESTCAKDLTQEKIPELVTLLPDLAKERSKDHLDYKRVSELLDKMGCTGFEALGADPHLLDNKTNIISKAVYGEIHKLIDELVESAIKILSNFEGVLIKKVA